MRTSLGARWAPDEVHFEHPRPEGWREHEQAFGAPVYFSRPSNALLFNANVLGVPMPTHDPRLMVAMRHCLEQIGGRPDLRAADFGSGAGCCPGPACRRRSITRRHCRGTAAGAQPYPARIALRRVDVHGARRGGAARSGAHLFAAAAAFAFRNRVPAGVFGVVGVQPRGAPVDRIVAAHCARRPCARQRNSAHTAFVNINRPVQAFRASRLSGRIWPPSTMMVWPVM